jgi:opacity protein-like surface antigen
MRGRTRGLGLTLIFAAMISTGGAGDAAAVVLLGHGPVVALGYSQKHDRQMALPSLGWRWRFSFADRVDEALASAGTRLTWYVEPMAAAVIGDENSGEVQVVPGLRIESISPWFGWAVPFLEGGIGLMYTGLDDLGLGSNILFSDNVGLGIGLHDTGWTFGYRYRHASHAGLWAESNAGLDVHYLTVRYDLPTPR